MLSKIFVKVCFSSCHKFWQKIMRIDSNKATIKQQWEVGVDGRFVETADQCKNKLYSHGYLKCTSRYERCGHVYPLYHVCAERDVLFSCTIGTKSQNKYTTRAGRKERQVIPRVEKNERVFAPPRSD